MGIFGGMKKQQVLGGYDQNAAMMGQSGFSPVAPIQPQGNPLAAFDGYNRDAAMQGQSGFAPMNVGFSPPAEAKKKGVNWAGVAADFLSGMAGQPGQFAAQQQHERAMQQRTQMQEKQRQQEREDYLWKQQNQATEPTAMERNLAAYSRFTPEQRRLYGEMNPLIQTLGDGSSRAVNRYDVVNPQQSGPLAPPPEAINDLRSNPASAAQFDEIFGIGAAARVLGGQVQPAPATFPGQ